MYSILQYVGGPLGALVIVVAGAAAVTVTIYLSSCLTTVRPSVKLDTQSEVTPVSNDEGIRESFLRKNKKHLEYLYEDAKTLFEAMCRGVRISGDGRCLGWRPSKDHGYHWLTYNEVMNRIKNFSSGLIHIGVKPGTSTYVGIYSQNCAECVISEQACYYHSMVAVPLYDTLGPNSCTFIINQAEITIVICDKEEKAKTLLDEISEIPSLKTIIVMKDISDEIKQLAEKHGIQILLFQDVEESGRTNPKSPMKPSPKDLAVVCYTSGTTGTPKGVMLTHGNIIANVSSVMSQLGNIAPTKNDVMISFLPLAHMLERCCQVALYMTGGSVGFYQGDIKILVDDMRSLRPTLSPCVPRLLNRIYDKVQSNVSGSKWKQWLLEKAFNSKKADLDRFVIRHSTFWDWFVFKQVRAGMGGRLRLMVVGSASLSGSVLTFIRCALGCVVIEGYGQTECVAPCTLTIPGDPDVDHVGPPLPCCSVKLVDVPEMEYFASEKKGEICVKGTTVFQGYLKDPVKTAETLDKEGWLHTGDIGMWLPNGTLKIIDRKNHIFKLAQGEFVAPEKIENIYSRSTFVAQIFIHGESLKSCLVGIVVPDREVLEQWCLEHSINDTWDEMCKNKIVKKTILEDLAKLGKEAGLNSFEQAKDIYIHPELFTVENGLLTPTLKTKRPECRKFFMSEIEAMYRVLV
ncbi:long-chain-fatty-acid--CoA ligase 5-like isoform X1 [Centruroides vittatus]|uniref:long-chain-fatty-acid--CoA ligase 5-like isoform X1 n=1 Tax=Centruroides vittatus TaxID=120091 RepID=UPI0035109584